MTAVLMYTGVSVRTHSGVGHDVCLTLFGGVAVVLRWRESATLCKEAAE